MDRNKTAFWLFILAVFLAASIPSTLLLDALGRYRSALAGFEPTSFRPIRVRSVLRDEPSTPLPNLEFVPFRLKAPKAKTVSLLGDFNAWKPGTLALSRRSGADWEVLVPLPPGRYRYVFMVDGEQQLDPASRDKEKVSGQDASVRVVP